MNSSIETHFTDLPPELSATEAALGSLEPVQEPGSLEKAKSTALLRLCKVPPPLSGEKLIETIVRSGDREITLSLREYIKSERFSATVCGAVVGVLLGALLGLLLGFGAAMLTVKSPPAREVHHIPYFIHDKFQ